MAQRWIDNQGKQHHEQDVRSETHATRHAPRDQGWCNDGKLELKQSKQQKRNGACEICVGAQAHPTKSQERAGISNNASQAVAKAQAESHKHPQHAYHPKGHKALKHGGNDVPFVHHPAVEECQTRCHQQHKGTRHHHPRGVARVKRRHGGFGCRLVVRCSQKPNRRHQQGQRQKIALSAHVHQISFIFSFSQTSKHDSQQ